MICSTADASEKPSNDLLLSYRDQQAERPKFSRNSERNAKIPRIGIAHDFSADAPSPTFPRLWDNPDARLSERWAVRTLFGCWKRYLRFAPSPRDRKSTRLN